MTLQKITELINAGACRLERWKNRNRSRLVLDGGEVVVLRGKTVQPRFALSDISEISVRQVDLMTTDMFVISICCEDHASHVIDDRMEGFYEVVTALMPFDGFEAAWRRLHQLEPFEQQSFPAYVKAAPTVYGSRSRARRR